MTTWIEHLTSDRLRQSYSRIHHKSGLTVCVLPKRSAVTYAVLGVDFGANDRSGIRSALHTGVGLALLLGIAVTGLGLFAGPEILRLTKTPENCMEDAVLYTKVYFSGAVASMGSAVAKTEDGKSMVFVRRYIQASGGYEGGNNHIEGDTLVDHVYDANEGMQIINFHRPASDKKDILFTNLGVHATFNGATTQVMLSADFPAGVRQQVEASGEYLSAHFISAGADQNPTSKLDDEQHNLTYMQYGQRIGQIALDCVDELGAVQLGAATVKSQTVTADGNIEDILLNKEAGVHDIKLYTAELVQTYFNNRDFSKADQVAKNIGFKGIYDAIGYIKRSNMAETREITVSTLVLGDLAFVLAPYEMFGGSAAELLEASPYENTFIITCCNGADGYVPKAGTYAYGCYESYTSYVAEGTAEVLVNTFVDLLKATKNG